MRYERTCAWLVIILEISLFSLRLLDSISIDTEIICASIISGAYIARGRADNG